MYNREILEKIIEEVGVKETIKFCRLVSLMYDIKYNASKDLNLLDEYEFERQWWLDVSTELKKDYNIIG